MSIDPDSVEKLLELCVSNVEFLFNGTYYRQVDGVAMGSSLGAILANIYVGYIEHTIADIRRDVLFTGVMWTTSWLWLKQRRQS